MLTSSERPLHYLPDLAVDLALEHVKIVFDEFRLAKLAGPASVWQLSRSMFRNAVFQVDRDFLESDFQSGVITSLVPFNRADGNLEYAPCIIALDRFLRPMPAMLSPFP